MLLFLQPLRIYILSLNSYGFFVGNIKGAVWERLKRRIFFSDFGRSTLASKAPPSVRSLKILGTSATFVSV